MTQATLIIRCKTKKSNNKKTTTKTMGNTNHTTPE